MTASAGSLLFSRSDLLGSGLTKGRLAAAVASGEILRIRRGVYAAPGMPEAILSAVRVGGRVACTTALQAAGAWVRNPNDVHIHLERSASRPRSPHSSHTPLSTGNRGGCVLHWRALVDVHSASDHAVSPVDALIQVICCQPERFAVAALDSSIRLGLIREDQLDVIFWNVPKRLRHLRGLVDPRSESILETIVRLLAKAAGLDVALQVHIAGVGRVDMVIGGRIVVETDGQAFHGSMTAERDYDRDLRLIERGYLVIRLNYRQVMFEPERVLRAIQSALRSHRRPR